MIRPDACRAFLMGLILAVSASVATAHQLTPQEAPAWAASPSGKTGPGIAFDWFSNAPKAAPGASQADAVRAANQRHLGHGSWICSPAGGGMSSSCFAR